MLTMTDQSTSHSPAKLAGWIPALGDDAALRDALDKALDYRGDVTITLRDGREITGYIFDRRPGPTLGESHLRLLPADGADQQTFAYDQIARLAFDSRDPAAGQSWETFLRKYAQSHGLDLPGADAAEGNGPS